MTTKAWWMHNDGSDKVKVVGTEVRQTEKAILLEVEVKKDSTFQVWIPLSQIDHISRWDDEESGERISEVTMTRWIAREKGLPYEEVK